MSKKTKNRIFMSQVIIGFAFVMAFLALVIIFSFLKDAEALKTGLIFLGISILLLVFGIYAYKRNHLISLKELKDSNLYFDEEDEDKLN